MNKTRVGVSFLLIATILYATRYICAAIGGIGATTWGSKEFAEELSHVPGNLMVLTIISLIAGIGFIVWGLMQTPKN
ncbi:hypothetical protein [Halobacillus sp. A5]|uniref:hypothetical protein n=1 Tax=Halobacillus sp. A5 TaxID=2880263 RepID=UPI0020A640BB|nr:hypothetical protein [Halobacillus sp. A5]MCP3027052.1 hypothetical protein [Halobacillus sp. A5]